MVYRYRCSITEKIIATRNGVDASKRPRPNGLPWPGLESHCLKQKVTQVAAHQTVLISSVIIEHEIIGVYIISLSTNWAIKICEMVTWCEIILDVSPNIFAVLSCELNGFPGEHNQTAFGTWFDRVPNRIFMNPLMFDSGDQIWVLRVRWSLQNATKMSLQNFRTRAKGRSEMRGQYLTE